MFRAQLGLEGATIGGVFVAVDGVTHLPQIAPQLGFTLPLDAHPHRGQCDRRQDGKNGDGGDQLNQRHAALAAQGWQLATGD